jgi:hypothetical protein
MIAVVTPVPDFLALSRSWFAPRVQAMRRDRAELIRIVQDLALARDLDDVRTTRALDLARLGLDYLIAGGDERAEEIARMHAVHRGATPGGDPSAADLREVARKVEMVLAHWPTGEACAPVLVAMLRGLGDEPGDPGAIDLVWLARRLDELRAARASRAKRPKVNLARVVAEIAWRAGAHGTAGRRARPQYRDNERKALDDFADALRDSVSRHEGKPRRRAST